MWASSAEFICGYFCVYQTMCVGMYTGLYVGVFRRSNFTFSTVYGWKLKKKEEFVLLNSRTFYTLVAHTVVSLFSPVGCCQSIFPTSPLALQSDADTVHTWLGDASWMFIKCDSGGDEMFCNVNSLEQSAFSSALTFLLLCSFQSMSLNWSPLSDRPQEIILLF